LAYGAEAERLAHKHIGTEHLLLGLLREENCFAAQILSERDVELAGSARNSHDSHRRPRPGPRRPFVLNELRPYISDLVGQTEPLMGRKKELGDLTEPLAASMARILFSSESLELAKEPSSANWLGVSRVAIFLNRSQKKPFLPSIYLRFEYWKRMLHGKREWVVLS